MTIKIVINIGWEGESRQLIASPIRIASLLPSRSAMHGPIPLKVKSYIVDWERGI